MMSNATALAVVARALQPGRADATALDWARVSPADASRLRSLLSDAYAPSSVWNILSDVRALLRQSREAGAIDEAHHDALLVALAHRVPALPGVMGRAWLEPQNNPVYTYLTGQLTSDNSRRTMLSQLNRVARMLSGGRLDAEHYPWHGLDYGTMALLRAALQKHLAPASVNNALTGVRMVLRECWRLGLLDRDQRERVSDVRMVKFERLHPGRWIEPPELRVLFAACRADETPKGARDLALIAIGYGCGLRVSEIVGLDLADVDRSAMRVHVREGKGNKDRLVPLPSAVLPTLNGWLAIRGEDAGPLFGAFDRGRDTRASARLTTASVRRLLLERCAEAGIPPCRPHDLRRSFISGLLDAGTDLALTQRLAGHEQAETTSQYDRRPFRKQAEAVERLAIPL